MMASPTRRWRRWRKICEVRHPLQVSRDLKGTLLVLRASRNTRDVPIRIAVGNDVQAFDCTNMRGNKTAAAGGTRAFAWLLGETDQQISRAHPWVACASRRACNLAFPTAHGGSRAHTHETPPGRRILQLDQTLSYSENSIHFMHFARSSGEGLESISGFTARSFSICSR
jgi:hypothetical protein